MKSINTVMVATMLTQTLNPVASVLASEVEENQKVAIQEVKEGEAVDSNFNFHNDKEMLENLEGVEDSLEEATDNDESYLLPEMPEINSDVKLPEETINPDTMVGDSELEEESEIIETQFVKFEDETFKQIILDQYDLDKDDKITLEEAEVIKEIVPKEGVLYPSTIKSLKGIEAFENLESLTLNGYTIEDMSSLTELTKLNSLDLSSCSLWDSFSSIQYLVNLEFLNLQNCSLYNIEGLEKLINLRDLNLANNTVGDISPIINLTKLEKLNFSSNNFHKNIHLIGTMKNLNHLSLDYTTIGDISFLKDLTNLKQLDINSNQIKDLFPISHLPNLLSVNAWGNPLYNSASENVIRLEGFDFLSQQVWVSALQYIDNQLIDNNRVLTFNEDLKVKEVSLNGLRYEVVNNEVTIPISDSNILTVSYIGHNGDFYDFYYNLEETSIPQGNITFGDDNLKKKIISFTKNIVDLNQDGEISYEEAAAVKSIDLSNQTPWSDGDYINFSSLSGLEHFVNLEKIEFDTGGFTDLTPLASLTKLKVFRAWYGSINDITPLSQIKTLEEVSLWAQPIQDLSPIREMKNLKEIDFQLMYNANDISAIAKLVKESNHHITFRQSENEFNDKDCANAVQLGNLTIKDSYGNEIEIWIVVDDYISYSVTDKEVSLTFDEGLDIKEIEINGQKQQLENNVLVIPNSDQFNQMTIYDTYGHAIPYNISHLKQTVEFEDAALKDKLFELGIDLDGNGEISSFEAQRVKSLDLSNAGIVNLNGLEAFENLSFINLSSNRIQSVEALKGLKKLSTVNLSHNSLSDLSLLKGISDLTKVTNLDLSNNSIENIQPITLLSGLQTLTLSHNQITDLTGISKLSSLSSLYADYNKVKVIKDLASCNELWQLDVSNNEINDLLGIASRYEQNQYFYYNIDNNPLYTGNEEGTVHLSQLDLREAEVWINPSDYYNLTMDGDKVSVTFDSILKLKDVQFNGESLKLQEGVVSFTKENKDTVLTVTDEYGHTYDITLDFVYEDNYVSFDQSDSNIAVDVKEEEGEMKYSISNISTAITEIIFKPKMNHNRARSSKGNHQFVIEVALENGATSFVVNGKSLADYPDGIVFDFTDTSDNFEVMTIDGAGNEVSKFKFEIKNTLHNSGETPGDPTPGVKPENPTDPKPGPDGSDNAGDTITPGEGNNHSSNNSNNSQTNGSTIMKNPVTGVERAGYLLTGVVAIAMGAIVWITNQTKKLKHK